LFDDGAEITFNGE